MNELPHLRPLLREEPRDVAADVLVDHADARLLDVLLERCLHLGRACEAIFALRRHRLPRDRRELGRRVRIHRQRVGLGTEEATLQDRRLCEVLRDPLADDAFPQEDAGREDVRAPIDRLVGDLLLRRVGDLALERAGLGEHRGARCLGDPEIDQLYRPAVTDEDVLRGHVAVHDTERTPVEIAELVRVVQACEHTREHAQVDRQRHLTLRAPEQHAERLALEIFHHEEVATVHLGKLERLDQVRVIEPASKPRFVGEHAHELGIRRELGQHLLHDQQLLRSGGARQRSQHHTRHAALPEQRDLAVASEAPLLIHDGTVMACTRAPSSPARWFPDARNPRAR